MGASSWVSRVPYQPDIAAALQTARWEVFRAGDFCSSPDEMPEARSMTEDEFVAWCVEEYGPQVGGEEARFVWRAAQTEPESPDALLAVQPYSGTHSVIDMTGVSDTPDDLKVAPVADELLDAMFSTRRPSTDAIEAAVAEGKLDLYGRWRGTYIAGHRDGTPETIFFVGHSGD